MFNVLYHNFNTNHAHAQKKKFVLVYFIPYLRYCSLHRRKRIVFRFKILLISKTDQKLFIDHKNFVCKSQKKSKTVNCCNR